MSTAEFRGGSSFQVSPAEAVEQDSPEARAQALAEALRSGMDSEVIQELVRLYTQVNQQAQELDALKKSLAAQVPPETTEMFKMHGALVYKQVIQFAWFLSQRLGGDLLGAAESYVKKIRGYTETQFAEVREYYALRNPIISILHPSESPATIGMQFRVLSDFATQFTQDSSQLTLEFLRNHHERGTKADWEIVKAFAKSQSQTPQPRAVTRTRKKRA